MKATLRFMSVVIVCTVVIGGILPAYASQGPAWFEQDAGAGAAGAARSLTAAELGVAPDAAPQAGPATAGAPAPAGVVPDRQPVVAVPVADARAVMGKVPPAEYGVDPRAVPQAEPVSLSFLYLPAVAGAEGTMAQAGDAGAPAPAVLISPVYAFSARTSGSSSSTQTIFNVGESIRYVGIIFNSTLSRRSPLVDWNLTGPCGSSTLSSGPLSVAPGYGQWSLPGTVPGCTGAYTFTLVVTYEGIPTEVSSTFTVNGPGSVSVSSVATLDGTDTPTSTFATGGYIQYVSYVNNTTVTSQTVPIVYTLDGPCGAGTLYENNVETPAGMQGWGLVTTAPTCVGVFTFTAQVTYSGITTQRSITFTTEQGATVMVMAARTADTSNTTDTAFEAGATIRYMGTISNTTGVTQTVQSEWSVAGDGCTGVLWAGDLIIVPGSQEWYLDGIAAPQCSGDNTFTLAVTYNGQTTTRDAAFTIAGGTVPPAPR